MLKVIEDTLYRNFKDYYDLQDEEGNTLLHLKNWELIRIVHENVPYKANKKGETPLQHIIQHKVYNLIPLFYKKEPDFRDNQGNGIFTFYL